MTFHRFCTVCDCTLGKGNVTGRCLRHGRTRHAIAPTIRKKKLLSDWCPPEYQADYRDWRKKYGAGEAKRIILDDIAAKERRA